MSLLLLLAAEPAGAYAHSFPGIRPAARYDDTPWITVTVAESSTRTGTFTNLVTATLDPAEADARTPYARDITVTGATLSSGWYRFTFTDANGDTQVLDPIFTGPGIRPTVQEVADLMPDRTTLDGGDEARAFTSQDSIPALRTTPSLEEVSRIIDTALDSVDPRVPAYVAPEIMRAARNVVKFLAATIVETGNWSDQFETNTERVALWERLLEGFNAALDAAVIKQATPPADPSAYSITTGLCNDMHDRTGRVFRDAHYAPWTGS